MLHIVADFMQNGGSFVTLAKGNRSKAVTQACKQHGGFYLGSIGGPAAILAQNCIKVCARHSRYSLFIVGCAV
jgi:fumarate hydratase class I